MMTFRFCLCIFSWWLYALVVFDKFLCLSCIGDDYTHWLCLYTRVIVQMLIVCSECTNEIQVWWYNHFDDTRKHKHFDDIIYQFQKQSNKKSKYQFLYLMDLEYYSKTQWENHWKIEHSFSEALTEGLDIKILITILAQSQITSKQIYYKKKKKNPSHHITIIN